MLIETKSWAQLGEVDSSIVHMGVSKNNGTPKSSILIGFSIINHPFWGTPIFGNIHIIFAKKQRNLKQCRNSLQHHQRERDSALEFDPASLPRLTLGPWVNLKGISPNPIRSLKRSQQVCPWKYAFYPKMKGLSPNHPFSGWSKAWNKGSHAGRVSYL